MVRNKSALIIGTEVATNGLESGASLRLESIGDLIERQGFSVVTTSRKQSRKELEKSWDLIVIVSFSTARLLRLARKKTDILWFDPTDSWTLTRLSLLRSGDLRHGLLYIRDLFWVWSAPKIDLVTFITRRDAERELGWMRFRAKPLILPVKELDREVIPSTALRFVFIGDGGYGPNKKAIKFLEETADLLGDSNEIHIYGKNATSSHANLISHGFVPRNRLYFSNDIHLAPVTCGAGLKLKVAVPLWNGLCVVTTPEGANGFCNSPSLLTANHPQDFAKLLKLTLAGGALVQFQKPRSNIFVDDESLLVENWLAKRFGQK